MISPDRKPGVKLVTDRLQAPRIGVPAPPSHPPADVLSKEGRRIIAEMEEAVRNAAKSE